MNTMTRILATAFTALCVAGAAQAAGGVTLNGVRVLATDSAKVAKFYQAAFGMKEVQRIENPNMLEIMLNWGDASPSRTGDIVIMSTKTMPQDATPHIVLNVTDMAATVAAIKAAGGKMDGDPKEFGKTGILIGMGTDPAGNHFELIQQPKH